MHPNTETAAGRKVRQPRSFGRFQCSAAHCEDTCCVGWGVPIDRQTYEKYKNTPDLQIAGRRLLDLVEISPAGAPNDYARFRMQNATCPILTDKLCGIQTSLGEAYMADLCVKYPRILNVLGNTVERSLDISCPEAARLVLSDPDAMLLHHGEEEPEPPYRPSLLSFLGDDPEGGCLRVRELLIDLIRDRSLPLWQRIGAVGSAVDRIADLNPADAVPVLEDYRDRLRMGAFNDTLSAPQPDSKFQLETVLEIVVARLSSDYTPRRFLDCYREFMQGLNWTPEATIEALVIRYDLAGRYFFQPFVRRHPHVFENYLISYIFKTIFPYRSRLPGRNFAIDASRQSLEHSFVLLALHYAILQTLLTGISALHKSQLAMEQAIVLMQGFAKAFAHSTTFDTAAFDYLRKAVSDPVSKTAQLVMPPGLVSAP